ncbi:MAG: glycosyltransferase family protein [Aggregatilineales bacterium]
MMIDQAGQTIDQVIPPAVAVRTVRQSRLRIPVWAATLGMLIAMAAVFWNTLGIRTTGLVEDWPTYEYYDWFGITFQTLAYTNADNRPFLLWIYAVGHFLTPDSFVGLQILSILMFIGSGMLLYGLVRQLLPNKPVVAFMAAALFVIYPADTGLFNTRYLPFQLAVVAYLAAVSLLILFWRRPRWWSLVGMWGVLLFCLGIVETAFPLAAVSPLVLIWLNKRVSRSVVRAAGAWYLLLIGMVVFTIRAMSGGNTLTSILLTPDTNPPLVRFGNYALYALRPYSRVFVDGWTEVIHAFSIGSVDFVTSALVFAFLVSLLGILVIVGLVIPNQSPSSTDSPSIRQSRVYRAIYARRAALILFGIGLVVIGLGFLPYVVVPGFRTVTDRVFLFSSIGGAVCISLIVYGIGSLIRRVPFVIPLLFGALLWLAAANGLGRAVGLRYDSSQEQLALAQIAQQMPSVPDGTAIIIFDRTLALSRHLWFFGMSSSSGYMESAIQYLYQGRNLRLMACWPGVPPRWEGDEACTIEANGVKRSYPGRLTTTFSYNKLVAFDYQPEKGFTLLTTWPAEYRTADNAATITSYNPQKLFSSSLPPARVFTLLNSWPYVPFVPHPLIASQSVRINWQEINLYPIELFQDPLITDGWTGAFTRAKTASANIWLAPDSSYQVKIHATWALTQDILNSLTLSVNGQPISLTRTTDPNGGSLFTGTIPQAIVALDPTNTLLEFHTDKVISGKSLGVTDDSRLFGVETDWLQIDPSATQSPVVPGT